LKLAGLLLTTGATCFGCNQATPPASSTTTTTTRTETVPNRVNPQATNPNSAPPGGRVNVDVGPNGATATGQTADDRDGANVNVSPNGGVQVDVQGEPIRDRLRERRAARDENLPR
jgi:hypothetical protein